MSQLRVDNLFDIDPFEDAFRGFLRPWKFEPGAHAPSIKIDLTENGVWELVLPKKATSSTRRLTIG